MTDESAFEYEDYASDSVVITKYLGNFSEVNIPDTLDGKKVSVIGENAFENRNVLTSVMIPYGVTLIDEGAFYDCPKLKSVIIPNSVTLIGTSAFGECKALTDVTLPNGANAIGSFAFIDCIRLKNLTLSDSLTYIGCRAFENCTSLTSVTIPDSVTEIYGNGGGMFDGDAFGNCKNIPATCKGKTYDYANIKDLYRAINGD